LVVSKSRINAQYSSSAVIKNLWITTALRDLRKIALPV
jgi:hypothetical protein